MTKNVGSIDRILRVVLGIALIAAVFLAPAVMSPWGWIGLVPLITGLVSSCPVYSLLGVRTCAKA